jgi:Tol biopolymer transport system component
VLARPDGSGVRRVPLARSFDPQFSADGRFLAVRVFVRGIAIGRWDAPRLRFVDRADWLAYTDMAWSPRSAQLVFARAYEGTEATKLILVSAPTGRRRTLGTGDNPTWSPNGRWIAFLDTVRATTQVMVTRPDGSGRRTLATFPDAGTDTTIERWSADGRKVVFRRHGGISGDDRLLAVNVSTGAIVGVPWPRRRQPAGVLSPDGRLLALSDANGVYVMRRDGSGRRRILGPPHAWRVDGFTIAAWQPVP